MGRTSKRRPKYTWLPTLGSVRSSEQPVANNSGIRFTLNTTGSVDPVTVIFPLTFDTPGDPDDVDPAAGGVLVNMVGHEYFLRRIVGKCLIAIQASTAPANDPSRTPGVIVTAGFFVARANDPDSGGGPTTPIGSASQQEVIDNYDSLSRETIRAPWIWRRAWILGNKARELASTTVQDFATNAANMFPPTTAHYGSVADGPHIDAKTARRVAQDERLFFTATAAQFPETPTNQGAAVLGYLDYRLLGQLRKAHNRGVF